MSKKVDWSKARQGPVLPPEPGKTRITIRIDTAGLDWFRDRLDRAGGGNYQTDINRTLHEYVQAQSGEPVAAVEERVRRIVRDELAPAQKKAPKRRRA
jgi:hypothetical protein